MPVEHYENFPVASYLLPKRLRHPVEVIYHFARTADDFADEGEDEPAQRLAKLAQYRDYLQQIEAGCVPALPLFQQLAGVIQAHQLPMAPFYALLDAFSQDVNIHRYETFGDLIQYCRRSANPVGQLLLHLYGAATPRNLALSDGICTALQLINFWQDIARDWEKGRVYLPQEDLRRFHVTEAQIASQDSGGVWWGLMQFEIERTRKMLQAGAPLAKTLPGRLGLELRLIVLGGERILFHLHRVRGDVFRHRPQLQRWDWIYMLWRALLRR